MGEPSCASVSGGVERAPGGGAPPSLASLSRPLSGGSGESPLLPPGELEALSAVLTESTDAAESRQHAQLFLAQAKSENVWLAQARKKPAEPSTGKAKPR